ncbi:MAG: hypothetical protein E6G00_13970, partial [Actinobacteria bacterium]
MAVVESPETLGIRPFHEFDAARETWPRGDRPAAIREAAETFRGRFKEQGQIRAIRTVDLVAAAYPTLFAFGGAAKGLNPYISIVNRLVVVQFEDFAGELRTLAWEPTVPEGSQEAPFYGQMLQRYGQVGEKLFASYYNTVQEALALCGLAPDDVDYIAFDHLHVQDVRILMGTDGKPGFFPGAKHLAQRLEVDTLRSTHPMQWAWYVPDGIAGIPEENLVLLDGDVELGRGIAFLWTPGHTDGNMSFCVNTPDGVWVSSENGVAADNWHPALSKIPGVRKWAEFFGREVVLNSNTLEDSIDQYDSMVLEKAVADQNRADPRFANVFPSSELASFKRQ